MIRFSERSCFGIFLIFVIVICLFYIRYLIRGTYKQYTFEKFYYDTTRQQCSLNKQQCYGLSFCYNNNCESIYKIFNISTKNGPEKIFALNWDIDPANIDNETTVKDTIFTNTGVTLYLMSNNKIYVSVSQDQTSKEKIKELLNPYVKDLDDNYPFYESDTQPKSIVVLATRLNNSVRADKNINKIYVLSPNVYMIHYLIDETIDLVFVDKKGMGSSKRLPYYKHNIEEAYLNSYVSTLGDTDPPGNFSLQFVLPIGTHWILIMNSISITNQSRRKYLPIRMDLLGMHAKPRELQYTDFTIEKINENISNWLTNDVRASRVISTNRNEGDIYGIVSNNFASKPKKKIRYFDSYANEFNTPLTNRPMDDLYNYIITDKVSDSLNPELTDSSTQVLHSKLSIDQKGFLREYLQNNDITIVQVIILLYGLLFFVHLEFGIGSEKEFNESEVEWFFIHNQSEKDIIDEKDKLISHVESYQDLIFKQMNRFGSRYNYGRNGYLLFRFYWDDLFINYFIDIFPAHKRYLFFHKNETSRENLQNLKDILLLIYDKIDTDLPLDKYNPKRIKHFKSMFGTFKKEFASKYFILDNQYVEGRTEYISCEDFKAKLDTLYEDGFQPVSYEKCNMMGK